MKILLIVLGILGLSLAVALFVGRVIALGNRPVTPQRIRRAGGL